MHESFITYKRARWLWAGLVLVLVSSVAYYFHQDFIPYPPNGGSWYGYTMGTIGALLILWLLALGRRKRAYAGNFGGPVQGWVSAHVYLGTALLVVATLHTGIQFGVNVHTLAYVLMCVVIFSGFFGVWAYVRYPDVMTANNQGRTQEEMFADLLDLDKQTLRVASRLSSELQQYIGSAIDRTAVGGGVWAQLTRKDSSMTAVPGGKVVPNVDQKRIVDLLVERLSQSSHAEENALIRQVVDLFGLRSGVLRRIRKDIQMHALMRIWLYVHIPLSFATVAALLVHVLSVFIYW